MSIKVGSCLHLYVTYNVSSFNVIMYVRQIPGYVTSSKGFFFTYCTTASTHHFSNMEHGHYLVFTISSLVSGSERPYTRVPARIQRLVHQALVQPVPWCGHSLVPATRRKSTSWCLVQGFTTLHYRLWTATKLFANTLCTLTAIPVICDIV